MFASSLRALLCSPTMMSLRTYGSLIPGFPVSPSPMRIRPTLNSSRRIVNCYSNHKVSRQIVAEELSISMYNRWIRYGCKRRGGIDEAMSLLAEWDSLGSHPEPLSYVTLIETLSDLGRTLEADALFQEAIRFGLHGSYPLRFYNALLGGYLRKGQLEFALRVLDHMELGNVDKNQETCEILLNYYVTAGRLEEYWRVVNEMKKRKFVGFLLDGENPLGLVGDNQTWKLGHWRNNTRKERRVLKKTLKTKERKTEKKADSSGFVKAEFGGSNGS
ncbi:hypothetical protein Rs2_16163 [Raphanus sativus]|nr:hypothetical protein Rs2_16163 [Raphanus sativus]